MLTHFPMMNDHLRFNGCNLSLSAPLLRWGKSMKVRSFIVYLFFFFILASKKLCNGKISAAKLALIISLYAGAPPVQFSI